MWAIGWRKAQEFLQIVGRYIKKFEADQRKKYDKHFQQSGRAGEVIAQPLAHLTSLLPPMGFSIHLMLTMLIFLTMLLSYFYPPFLILVL
ncbi:hypothetical protein VP01_142g13 [Puccinia sorghi]|uniref:Tet-like 2OG-Fe(II) oxygenase domain-containing protein n=1 Tax=Puccinia sorghi TaxID=27349 RepID=A0A0L6VKG6_9BASI|nr:hypothetical protein VP01_142g13 [Puccinia sorghi]